MQIHKKKYVTLKGQLINRERRPQELNGDHWHRTTNNIDLETSRTASIGD
ncbi:MAG: hypothetical protein ACFFG0_52890 [Candidatus Thorarchaeota archaeon]